MSVDLSYYSSHVDEWCNDNEFINCRSVAQLSQILDISKLTSKQFHQLFSIVNKLCNLEETITLMQHVHFSTHDDLEECCSFIHYISELFNIPFIGELSNDIKYIHKFEIRSYEKKSSIETPAKVSTSDENVSLLQSLEKTMDNFEAIYEILEKATKEDDEYTIKFAVEEKYSDVRSHNYYFDSLLYAATREDDKVAKLLIKYGANITSRTREMDSLLHVYALHGNLEGVKYCVKYLDVNILDAQGNSPLHCCVGNATPDVLNYLLTVPGINVNLKNNVGLSPLGKSIKEGYLETSKILINCPLVDARK